MNINYEEIKKIVIDKNDILKQLNKINKLLGNLELTNSLEEVIKLMDEINKIRDHFLTLYWISYIRYLLNINDEKNLQTEKDMSELEPLMEKLKLKYYKIIINSKYKDELIKIFGSRLFEIASNESTLLNDNIAELTIKEKELYKQYISLIINTKFNFNGEKLNLSGLNKYLQSDDRNIRKAAYDKRFEILMSLEEKLDDILNQLIKVRQEIAIRLGFNSYSQVGYIKMNRIGYTKEDIKIFRDQVKKYIVPIIGELKEMQRQRLGLDALKYYDNAYLFADGNAKVIGNIDDIINKTSKILNSVCIESGKLFDTMIKDGLINLDNTPYKSNTGLTAFLPDYKMPIFIKKYMGLDDNITSIHHEFGHALQLYYSRDLRCHENRWPTFDICEIYSTAMEFLMYPHIKKYFGKEDYKYKIKHLTNILSLIINMSAYDEFQNFIYDNPGISNQERKNIWLDICKKYYPYRNEDHPYFNKGIEWQIDTNRIDTPFYGIDYALAAICALSFYEERKNNEQKALEDFINLCKIGGSKSFKEIIDITNLKSPFAIDDIKCITILIKKEIKNLSVRKM